MIAQDSFRFDLGKHFPITLQEEFLLVSTIVMCRYHISGNRHCAALWNPKKTKIEGTLISPIHSWDHSYSLICKICAAPAVAECIIKLHTNVQLF